MIVAALVIAQTAPLTFDQIEQKKFEAFTKLTSFSGRYDVISVPGEGAGQRQAIELAITQASRRVKVTVNGNPLVESAWSKDQKWIANHNTRAYFLQDDPGKVELFGEYKALPVEKGRMNFIVNDLGPRFNTDPAPVIKSNGEVTEEGKTYTRIESLTTNAETQGTVKIIQFFPKGTWIPERFTVEVDAKGKKMLEVVGFLRDYSMTKPVDSSVFVLPAAVKQNYTRVSG
ncbi:MAG: hypothetical protein KDC26_11950 [Armatimonadetes bacterium]|nr:hypothetical protein [Armatimonadota bacterium]